MYVYMLKCSDGTFYVGKTNNILRRLDEHRYGLCRYTSGRRPVKLVYLEYVEDSKASLRERQLKKLPRYKKLQLVRDDDSRA